MLEPLLGVDQDRRVQDADARRSCSPTTSSTDNYLSTELRVPVTLLQTNVCSPLATNAIAGNIWDNFSSESYKELPSVGTVKVRHPVTGAEYDYTLPGGGRGYTRPASLVSLWSTAPFLQNNTVGPFDPEPVGRGADAACSRRRSSRCCGPSDARRTTSSRDEHDGPGVGVIDRTTADSYLEVPEGYVPDDLRRLLGLGQRLLPVPRSGNGDVEIGPIPEGHAGQPAGEHRSARRRPAPSRARART